MTDTVLSFDRVSVTKGKQAILKDVSFSLKCGEITALIGRNGSGKTTLLRTALGIQGASGNITVGGIPLSLLSPRSRARRIGLMPQFLPTSELPLYDFVMLGRMAHASLFAAPSKEDHESVSRALSCALLSDMHNRRVSSLSGGERTRAFIALLLSQAPPLLLMDEPTAFLDAPARKAFYATLRRLVAVEGKSILTVMHDVGDALTLADRVLVLDEGRLIFDGTPARCVEENVPARIFSLEKHTSMESGRLFFE